MAVLTALDAAALRRWCSACVQGLERHRQEIDELNVYPVPDRDTGTNLLLTLRSAAELLHEERPVELATTAAAMARGALLGARGNSGVIVSQILQGLAEVLAEADGDAGGPTLRAGLSRAADLAYTAVADPVEGTMLTVARAASMARPQPDSDELAAVLSAAAAAAAAALAATTQQLPALARAGVVDAGSRGLCVLLDALLGVVTGEEQPPTTESSTAESSTAESSTAESSTAESSTAESPTAGETGTRSDTRALERLRESGSEEFGYEVQYLLTASASAVAQLKAELADLGDCLAVVGSGAGQDAVWNVHVHVNDVGAAVEAGVRAGRPQRITVTRFRDQMEADRATPPSRPEWAGRALIAVAPGEGLGSLFEAEGVVVVDGGATSNPSIAEVLEAIQGTRAAQVVILPNHGNVTAVADASAAQARDAGQDVAVVPTRSPVQGLAAVAVADPQRRFPDDVIAMAEAAAATRWAEVTVATRDALTSAGRCRAGATLGLADGDVVLIGESVQEVSVELIDRLLLAGGEMVTAIVGSSAPAGLADVLDAHVRRQHPTVECVLYDGGQPDYPLLLGIE